MSRPTLLALASFVLCCLATPAPGQESVDPTRVDVKAAVEAVTVYRGRAAVTRRATPTLDAGAYIVTFGNLPESVQPDTLQARAEGASARIVSVEFRTRERSEATSPRLRELDKAIREHEERLGRIEQDGALLTRSEQLVDAVATRIARGTLETDGRAAPLDLDDLKPQLAFVEGERTRLLDERRELDAARRTTHEALSLLRQERDQIAGRSRTERTAEVTVITPASGTVAISLVYLVTQATWSPVYNLRAATDGSAVAVEFDAEIAQRTGEEWTDVALTLSTAQPSRAANPPDITPWFVDVQPPVADGRRLAPSAAAVPMEANKEMAGMAGDDRREQERFRQLTADATVGGAGPSVTYTIPRRVTVPSDAREQQRTRVAGFETTPEYVHVAVPLLTDAVYIRGSFHNTSVYTLLPGRAAVFIGQDFVGPTNLETIAPGAPVELYFGIDPSVTATRTVVAKETEKTGLLGGGRKTSSSYRLEIINDAGKPIRLELWDRIAVSRNEQIGIELVQLSHPLVTDPEYIENERRQGLLKWMLSVPPRTSSPLALTYGVNVTHGKEVRPTPLPD